MKKIKQEYLVASAFVLAGVAFLLGLVVGKAVLTSEPKSIESTAPVEMTIVQMRELFGNTDDVCSGISCFAYEWNDVEVVFLSTDGENISSVVFKNER